MKKETDKDKTALKLLIGGALMIIGAAILNGFGSKILALVIMGLSLIPIGVGLYKMDIS